MLYIFCLPRTPLNSVVSRSRKQTVINKNYDNFSSLFYNAAIFCMQTTSTFNFVLQFLIYFNHQSLRNVASSVLCSPSCGLICMQIHEISETTNSQVYPHLRINSFQELKSTNWWTIRHYKSLQHIESTLRL